MLPWTWGCGYLFKVLILFLFDKHPEVEFLDYMVVLFLNFWGSSIIFFIVAAKIYFLTSSAPGMPFLHIQQIPVLNEVRKDLSGKVASELGLAKLFCKGPDFAGQVLNNFLVQKQPCTLHKGMNMGVSYKTSFIWIGRKASLAMDCSSSVPALE